VTCPTLLVRGRESWEQSPTESGVASWFPSARVSEYDGAGHWVHHDQLDRFVAEVTQFLSD
jgi:pimeloyl-ACP methyl ester carboxylesterase